VRSLTRRAIRPAAVAVAGAALAALCLPAPASAGLKVIRSGAWPTYEVCEAVRIQVDSDNNTYPGCFHWPDGYWYFNILEEF
jgi:hypothetical protein